LTEPGSAGIGTDGAPDSYFGWLFVGDVSLIKTICDLVGCSTDEWRKIRPLRETYDLLVGLRGRAAEDEKPGNALRLAAADIGIPPETLRTRLYRTTLCVKLAQESTEGTD
jgi:hypothetical protein